MKRRRRCDLKNLQLTSKRSKPTVVELEDMPNEILAMIFQYFDLTTKKIGCLVSKRWKDALKQDRSRNWSDPLYGNRKYFWIQCAADGHMSWFKRMKLGSWIELKSDPRLCAAAVPNTEMLGFLRDVGCVFDSTATYAAAKQGSLLCLKWLRLFNCPFGKNIGSAAIYNENMEILQYLYQKKNYRYNHGLDDLKYACEIAHIQIFDYVYQQLWEDDNLNYLNHQYYLEAFLQSFGTGKCRCGDRIYPFLKHLIQKFGISVSAEETDEWPSKSTFWIFEASSWCKDFDEEMQLKCFKLMTTHGCPWTWNILREVSKCAEIDEYNLENIDFLKSLVNLNCPITNDFVEKDCVAAPVSFFQFLHEAYDLDLTENLFTCFVLAHNEDVVQYLLDHGCPWSRDHIMKRIQEEDREDCEGCDEMLKFIDAEEKRIHKQ